jgi:cell division septum initiation protein DivIVA
MQKEAEQLFENPRITNLDATNKTLVEENAKLKQQLTALETFIGKTKQKEASLEETILQTVDSLVFSQADANPVSITLK